MKAQTKKLTTAAVCTALAVIMCALTAYLPLSFMPLFLAAFCIFLACKRGSLVYGLLCALASIGLMFLMSGLSVKWFVFVIVFAPYGVLSYFLGGLSYRKVKTALIRGLSAAVYFNLTVGAVYLIAVKVAGVGLEGLNISAWSDMLGGYAVFALIATAVLLPLDVVFSGVSAVVLKKLPAVETKADMVAREKQKEELERNAAAPEYDIFGYEIHRDTDGKSENAPLHKDDPGKSDS